MNSPEQLIRELSEILRARCPVCARGNPILDDKDGYDHKVGTRVQSVSRCALKKVEQELLQRADTYLMDGR